MPMMRAHRASPGTGRACPGELAALTARYPYLPRTLLRLKLGLLRRQDSVLASVLDLAQPLTATSRGPRGLQSHNSTACCDTGARSWKWNFGATRGGEGKKASNPEKHMAHFFDAAPGFLSCAYWLKLSATTHCLLLTVTACLA